jgi:hypothetical protein
MPSVGFEPITSADAFTIINNEASQVEGLLWTSDQLVAEISP